VGTSELVRLPVEGVIQSEWRSVRFEKREGEREERTFEYCFEHPKLKQIKSIVSQAAVLG
jgi:hypothetical protein